jgi:hypothetical protein
MPWLLWNYDKQSWPNRELLIVDSSPEPYQTDRADVRVLTSAPGTGVATKRNLALDHAGGVIITWFDDDDWQHPDKLTLLAEALLAKSSRVAVGSRCGWFVDLHNRRCTHYRGTSAQPIFNSAGFRLKPVQTTRFPENMKKATDTRWLQALRRRFPRQIDLLDREDLFFWLCHEQNLSNPAGRWQCSRPMADVVQIAGEAWRDTDAEMAALAQRLDDEDSRMATAAPHPKFRVRPVIQPAAPESLPRPQATDEQPAVSVFIKATVLDVPYLGVMARHMLAQAAYPFTERAIVVERHSDFAGKYRDRARASDADLNAVLKSLLEEGTIDTVHEVDSTAGEVQAVMDRYFARDAQRVPTHAVTGGPIYATLFGLEQMPTDLVLQMDADVFFYSNNESWVAQSLRCMTQDPTLWLMMTHPGPPAGPPGRSLAGANARRARWDRRLQLWRFRTATTRYFLCDRRSLRGHLLPLFDGNSCRPLEQCISHTMQHHNAFRGNLGEGQSWHLHAWSHADPFPAWAPALVQLVSAGHYPELQRGHYDLRLDHLQSRRAWQELLPVVEKAPEPAAKTVIVKEKKPVPAPETQNPNADNASDPAPLAVVIPVRDRAGRRVCNALRSLSWQTTGPPAQVVVVSQGSRPDIDRALTAICRKAGAELLITGTADAPWNKPLALNVGIRTVRPNIPYVMTMDVDMILASDFFEAVLAQLQQEPPTLVLCQSLDLPASAHLPAPERLEAVFNDLRRQAKPRARSGTGGIQAATRDFFYEVRGYDEDLLWWGAMDGDMVNRARLAGLSIVWIDDRTSMLHQWHPRKYHNLKRSEDMTQARVSWTRNHDLVRERANQAQRNPAGWGTRSR